MESMDSKDDNKYWRWENKNKDKKVKILNLDIISNSDPLSISSLQTPISYWESFILLL